MGVAVEVSVCACPVRVGFLYLHTLIIRISPYTLVHGEKRKHVVFINLLSKQCVWADRFELVMEPSLAVFL